MPVPVTGAASPRRLIRDEVFLRLLDAIVDGDLLPGEQLYDAEIERWVGVSRTPVREALNQLAAMGLVEILPQRRTRVTPIEPERLRDLITTVGVLIAGVVRDATPLLTDADREALRAPTTMRRRAVRTGLLGRRLPRRLPPAPRQRHASPACSSVICPRCSARSTRLRPSAAFDKARSFAQSDDGRGRHRQGRQGRPRRTRRVRTRGSSRSPTNSAHPGRRAADAAARQRHRARRTPPPARRGLQPPLRRNPRRHARAGRDAPRREAHRVARRLPHADPRGADEARRHRPRRDGTEPLHPRRADRPEGDRRGDLHDRAAARARGAHHRSDARQCSGDPARQGAEGRPQGREGARPPGSRPRVQRLLPRPGARRRATTCSCR